MSNRRTRKSAPPADPLPARIHSVPVSDENELVPDESLDEAESEIGQNTWIDPETGELAEGEGPPHLDEE